MNLTDAAILGVVEGLTEFLPISSTGHLILANHLLGLDGDTVKTFDIVIQLGAILSVVVLFHHRFAMLFRPEPGKRFSGALGWRMLAITSLPAMVIGFLTHHYIETYLFSPLTVILALAVVGLLIILVERLFLRVSTKSIDQITEKQALQVGLFQCLALWPGTSRSGATIIGGMLSGLDRKVAAEYSFIAAVPIMVVATVYDLYKNWHQLHAHDYPAFAVGFIMAFISAIIAVKGLVHLVQRHTLTPFGYYRIAIALAYFFFIGI